MAPSARSRSKSRTVTKTKQNESAVHTEPLAQPPTQSLQQHARRQPRWLSANPDKRWGEIFFLYYSAAWIAFFGGIVVSGAWERFTHAEYMAVCLAVALPAVLGPALLQPPWVAAATPFSYRYWVKANIWVAIFSLSGHHFWTHYFFKLLGASYTFPSWRINGVPICLYFATVAYFVTYHTLTSIGLRRWWTSHAYAALPRLVRALATGVIVFAMAWFTAFAEAWTIQGFPYYAIKDRMYLYTIGSVVYGLYFVVSFPMFSRIDEDAVVSERTEGGGRRSLKLPKGVWTATQTALDALAASMLVTILLEVWRLGVMSVTGLGSGGDDTGSLPWLP